MPILTILLILVVAGVLLYLINRHVPMDPKIKTVINWFVVIVVIIWLLKVTGIWGDLSGLRV